MPSSDHHSPRLCFASVAFGGYERYAPLFAYTALRLVPGAKVVVHLDAEPSETMEKWARRAESVYGGEVVYETRHLHRFERVWGSLHLIGGVKKAARWVNDGASYTDCDVVLTGDVDTVFLERTGWCLDDHLSFMGRTGLPLSNKQRADGHRLSGYSHLVAAKDYFAAVEPTVQQLLSNREDVARIHQRLCELRQRTSGGQNRVARDENVLWWICNESFDLAPLQDWALEPAIPGLHLGPGRAGARRLAAKGLNDSQRRTISALAAALDADDHLRELVSEIDDDRLWSLLIVAGFQPPEWGRREMAQWRVRAAWQRAKAPIGRRLDGYRVLGRTHARG